MTVSEYRRLPAVAPNLRWQSLYALLYTSGARVGELHNMTWADCLPPNVVKFYMATRRLKRQTGFTVLLTSRT